MPTHFLHDAGDFAKPLKPLDRLPRNEAITATAQLTRQASNFIYAKTHGTPHAKP
jgi:hypothetical protein